MPLVGFRGALRVGDRVRWRRAAQPIAGGLHGGGAPHFAMGGPHRGGPHGTPLRPRNAVSPWEAGAPRSASSLWEAAANPWLGAIARARVLEVRIQSPPGESRANFCTGTGRDALSTRFVSATSEGLPPRPASCAKRSLGDRCPGAVAGCEFPTRRQVVCGPYSR